MIDGEPIDTRTTMGRFSDAWFVGERTHLTCSDARSTVLYLYENQRTSDLFTMCQWMPIPHAPAVFR